MLLLIACDHKHPLVCLTHFTAFKLEILIPNHKIISCFSVYYICGFLIAYNNISLLFPCLSTPPSNHYRYMSLSLALRYVLESLKKPPSSKMYLFGLAALDKFKSRLHEFSQYCASISSIPHFPQFPPMLIRVYIYITCNNIECVQALFLCFLSEGVYRI